MTKKKKILIGCILMLIAILALPQTRRLLYILSERSGAKKIEKMRKDWANQPHQPKEGAHPKDGTQPDGQ